MAAAGAVGGPTPMEEYFFDLRGYTILPQVLSRADLHSINEWVLGKQEMALELPDGEWIDDEVQLQSYYSQGAGTKGRRNIDDGINLQHVYEAGAVFERLLDHPAWFGRVEHYLGQFKPFVHELFINLRGPGGYIGCHSGGPRFDSDGSVLSSRWGATADKRTQNKADKHAQTGTHRGHHVHWGVPYISMIIALEDILEGDGATVIVEGSHKSLVGHPFQQQMSTVGDEVEGAKEMHLRAGDALFFQDSVLHGAAARTNSGLRKTICFRYLPAETSKNRFGYVPSKELMARLTERRRQLLTEVAGHDHDPWASDATKEFFRGLANSNAKL
eukprot:SAG11_NODE_2871_length_2882_cov_1.938556_1_plen_330_part_00